VGARVLPVDLVDNDDGLEAQLQRLGGHELRLGHRAFGCVHQKNHAVDHRQDALDFAAKVGVAWRVDDVDACAVPVDTRALRKDGDPAFAFEFVRVHGPFHDLLVLAEGSALAKKLVDESCFPVVDMGDDGDVAQIHLNVLEL
jgi:hypothetical protein